MFSMIRQRRASFSHVNSIGIQKNSFNSFELYHLRRNSSTLSVIVLLNLTVIPLKITLTISLGSSPCTTPSYWTTFGICSTALLARIVICSVTLANPFPELSYFIIQSLNVESLRPFRYAKSAFEIFSHFQFLTDTLSPFRFCILQCTSSLAYQFPHLHPGIR